MDGFSRLRRRVLWAWLAISLLSVPAAEAQDWLYTVRPGDNLWNLTLKYLTGIGYLERLQALNGIQDPYRIPPGTVLAIPLAWMKTQEVGAALVHLQGQAEVIPPGGGVAKPAVEGMRLVSGDRVRTEAAANATLEFVDGSRLLLQADSELQLQRLRAYGDSGMVDTRAHLLRGRTENRVQPRVGPGGVFEIHTPAAVTSVRGTGYRVSADAQTRTARAEVVDGRVGVAGAKRRRLLRAGFGTITTVGKAPLAPVPLLSAPNLGDVSALFERVPLTIVLPPLGEAAAYRVQVAASEEFSPLLFDALVDAAQLRGPDLPDGDYLLRVRRVDQRGLEGLDARRQITVNARPEPPFLLQPAPEGAVLEERPTFSWSSREGTVSYRVQLAAEPGFAEPLLDVSGIKDSQLQAPKTLAPGIYHWRVAATEPGAGTGPFSDPQSLRRPPPGPAVEKPTLDQDNLVIRWRAGAPGQQYELQLARDETFSAPLVSTRTPEPKFSVPRPKPGHYFLRVRTIDVDGYVGPYGPTQRFDVPSKFPSWLLLLVPLLPALL